MAGNAGHASEPRKVGARAVGWGSAALLLLAPLVAMQFTDEVAWDGADFAILGMLLAVAGGAFEVAARMTRNLAYRAAVGIALAAAVVLVWALGAVGLVGTERDPADAMNAGVIAVAAVGAAVARLRPRGMARAMVATAAAQALVAVIAYAAGWGNAFLPTAFFVALWLGAAALFRKAARQQAAAGLPDPP